MLVESEVDNDVELEEFFDCLDSLDDLSWDQQGEGIDQLYHSMHCLVLMVFKLCAFKGL